MSPQGGLTLQSIHIPTIPCTTIISTHTTTVTVAALPGQTLTILEVPTPEFSRTVFTTSPTWPGQIYTQTSTVTAFQIELVLARLAQPNSNAGNDPGNDHGAGGAMNPGVSPNNPGGDERFGNGNRNEANALQYFGSGAFGNMAVQKEHERSGGSSTIGSASGSELKPASQPTIAAATSSYATATPTSGSVVAGRDRGRKAMGAPESRRIGPREASEPPTSQQPTHSTAIPSPTQFQLQTSTELAQTMDLAKRFPDFTPYTTLTLFTTQYCDPSNPCSLYPLHNRNTLFLPPNPYLLPTTITLPYLTSIVSGYTASLNPTATSPLYPAPTVAWILTTGRAPTATDRADRTDFAGLQPAERKGAIAGIAIGVVMGLVIFAGLCWCLRRRRVWVREEPEGDGRVRPNQGWGYWRRAG